MSLKEQLMEDMKLAMKAKEAGKTALSVIRMVRASIRNTEIDDKKDLNDDEVLQILLKEVKMRHDSLDEFRKANRMDLAEQIEAELEILKKYLPEPLSEAELKEIVQQAVTEAKAETVKDMGKVMALVMPRVKGRADGKAINALVRQCLNA